MIVRNTLMRWWGLLTAGTLLMAPVLAGQTYFDRILPAKRPSFSARSMALGNTGTASAYGSYAMITNPSLLWQAFLETEKDHVVMADASFTGTRPSENRIFPLLDTFGDIITDNIYATNSPLFGYGDFGLLYKYNRNFYLGFGSYAYVIQDYTYKERLSAQLTNTSINRDPFLDNNIIDTRGVWRTYSVSANQRLGGTINIGGTLNLIRAEGLHDHYRYVTMNGNYSTTVDTVDIDRSYKANMSVNGILGASYQVTPHLLLGVSVEAPFNLKTKNNNFYGATDTLTGLPISLYDTTYTDGVRTYPTVNVTYHNPLHVSFGVEFRPQNELFSRITMELTYTNWSAFKETFGRPMRAFGRSVTGYDPQFDNTWDFKIGVEHMFFGYVPVRFGFSHLNSPMSGEFVTSAFDVGGGFERGPFRLDAALEIANRDYKYRILFIQPGLNRSEFDKIEESAVRFQATMSYRFGY